MDQEATNPEFVEMSDFDEEEVISTKKKEKVLVLGVWSAESTEERQGRRVGVCGWHVYLSDRHAAV